MARASAGALFSGSANYPVDHTTVPWLGGFNLVTVGARALSKCWSPEATSEKEIG